MKKEDKEIKMQEKEAMREKKEDIMYNIKNIVRSNF